MSPANPSLMPVPLARHTLVWLSAQAWRHAQSHADGERQRAALLRWQQANWPAVVRRADADAAADEVCAGVALPPDAQGDKLRIALKIPRAQVTATCAALTLADVTDQLRIIDALGVPDHWLARLDALQAEAARLGITLRVYGSLALQAITGLPYARASSDIDLLFQPADANALAQGMALLVKHAAHLPLDGELLLPGDTAVAWKEWQQATPADRVLVKRLYDVALLRVDSLLALFDTDQACAKAAA